MAPHLLLQVKDTGIGILPDLLERLFNKFEQGDLAITRRYGGTGLGLAICQDLVRLMGGDIVVVSTAGQGSTFTARVPLAYSGPQTSEPPPPDMQQAPQDSASVRLLVAEDNRANQFVIDILLRQMGIVPVIVPDGQAAIEAWEEAYWDLILMDVQMPEVDGPTATTIIRQREIDSGRHRTPILALTANAMEHQLAEYREAGMDDVLAKPIEVKKLVVAINRAMTARERHAPSLDK